MILFENVAGQIILIAGQRLVFNLTQSSKFLGENPFFSGVSFVNVWHITLK